MRSDPDHSSSSSEVRSIYLPLRATRLTSFDFFGALLEATSPEGRFLLGASTSSTIDVMEGGERYALLKKEGRTSHSLGLKNEVLNPLTEATGKSPQQCPPTSNIPATSKLKIKFNKKKTMNIHEVIKGTNIQKEKEES